MKRTITRCLSILLVASAAAATAGPEEDRAALVDYFTKRFPGVALERYVDGAYAFDADAYEQWQQIQEFPQHEPSVEEGETLFKTPFANGKTYAECFENGGTGIRQGYPRWDEEQGQVVTLELAINQCREKNGEKPLGWFKGPIAAISAYMAYTSRGNPIDIKVPNEKALAAYEEGKAYYYSKRGQLNFSCADCHVVNANNMIRADRLSPMLGQTTHFPVYRSKWGEMGTLHRRFKGCNEQIRGVALEAQSPEYRNLEYFLSYASNGLPVNGPGDRK
jgi:sulfur-oxidizing protein SoxA